jgi:hypothetical protein
MLKKLWNKIKNLFSRRKPEHKDNLFVLQLQDGLKVVVSIFTRKNGSYGIEVSYDPRDTNRSECDINTEVNTFFKG